MSSAREIAAFELIWMKQIDTEYKVGRHLKKCMIKHLTIQPQ